MLRPHQSVGARAALAATLLGFVAHTHAAGEFRVCAEPDNLPFSNQRKEGFENKIAALLAHDLKAKLTFTWEKQRQGYIRQTLGAHRCDVIMGVPKNFDRALTTQPYYRSSYVFVTLQRRHLSITSFDDPILRELKIGLHAFGNDGSNSPPAQALARRGLATNVVGYSLWGESSVDSPQGQLVDAVVNGDVDVAIVWGPIGGYFARKHGQDLLVAPAPADPGMPGQPFEFDISIGVRKDATAFAARLDDSLRRKQREIEAVLAGYNVPHIQLSTGGPSVSTRNSDQTLLLSHNTR